MGFQNFDDKNNQTTGIRYKQINSVYLSENVPAIKDEEYLDNLKNYKSSIQYELERTRFPDQPVKDFTITWEGVAKTIFENKNFGKELNEQLYIIQDVKMILKNVVSKEEKLDVILSLFKIR